MGKETFTKGLILNITDAYNETLARLDRALYGPDMLPEVKDLSRRLSGHSYLMHKQTGKGEFWKERFFEFADSLNKFVVSDYSFDKSFKEFFKTYIKTEHTTEDGSLPKLKKYEMKYAIKNARETVQTYFNLPVLPKDALDKNTIKLYRSNAALHADLLGWDFDEEPNSLDLTVKGGVDPFFHVEIDKRKYSDRKNMYLGINTERLTELVEDSKETKKYLSDLGVAGEIKDNQPIFLRYTLEGMKEVL